MNFGFSSYVMFFTFCDSGRLALLKLSNKATWSPGGGGGGGVLRFGSDGAVPLKPPNLYPSLRVILAEKGTHY